MILYILTQLVVLQALNRVQLSSPLQFSIIQRQELTLSPFPDLQYSHLTISQFSPQKSSHSICQIWHASVNLTIASITNVQQLPQYQWDNEIYDLRDLQNMRYSLDIILHQGLYYIAFKDGTIDVFEHNLQQKTFDLKIKLRRENPFTQGFFVHNWQSLLFVTGKDATLVTQTELKPVDGYTAYESIADAKLSQNNLLFIALEAQGFSVYELIEGALQNEMNYNKDNLFNEDVEIVDIDYDLKSNVIFVLDRPIGVRFFNRMEKYVQVNNTYVLYESGCQNLLFNNSYVYLTCPELVKYDMISNLTQKQTRADMNPIQILIRGQSLFISSNQRVVYYKSWQAQPLSVHQYSGTRVILAEEDSSLVHVNDYEMVSSQLQYIPSSISCSSQDEGEFFLDIEAEGRCNKTFLDGQNSSLDVTVDQDCEYVRKVFIKVFPPPKIHWIPLIIGVGALIWFFGAFTIWCIVRKVTLERRYQELTIRIDTQMKEQQIESASKVDQPVPISPPQPVPNSPP